MKRKYYLKKGCKIGKPGLPNGILEAKDKDMEIEDKHVAIIEKNLHHFIKAEKVIVKEIEEKSGKKSPQKPKPTK